MKILSVEIVDPPRPGMLQVIQTIRPEWKPEDVIIETLEGGYINKMYMCKIPADVHQNDVILIRVYGTRKHIDRERECLVMRMVHSAGLGAQVYCRFINGLAYKFLKGSRLTGSSIEEECIARAVARKLASLHALDIDKALIEIGEEAEKEKFTKPFKWSDYVHKTISNIPEQYEDVEKSTIRLQEFPDVNEAVAMVTKLEFKLYAMGFPLALVHTDPHPENIIHDPLTGDVHLVDWEFSGLHYPPLDIAVFFIGVFMVHGFAEEYLALYPEKEYQLRWIRWYLEYQAELAGKDPDGVTEDQVLHWYKGSINCALQFTQTVAFLFLEEDALIKTEPNFFRMARTSQQLFHFIQKDHCKKFSLTSVLDTD